MVKEITQDIVDKIDFKELEKRLTFYTDGETIIHLKVTFKNGRLSFQSQDLSKKAGILSGLYEYLVIDTFGRAGLTEDNMVCFQVHFSWRYNKGGGMNGTELLTAWYDLTNAEWIIKI